MKSGSRSPADSEPHISPLCGTSSNIGRQFFDDDGRSTESAIDFPDRRLILLPAIMQWNSPVGDPRAGTVSTNMCAAGAGLLTGDRTRPPLPHRPNRVVGIWKTAHSEQLSALRPASGGGLITTPDRRVGIPWSAIGARTATGQRPDPTSLTVGDRRSAHGDHLPSGGIHPRATEPPIGTHPNVPSRSVDRPDQRVHFCRYISTSAPHVVTTSPD